LGNGKLKQDFSKNSAREQAAQRSARATLGETEAEVESRTGGGLLALQAPEKH